MEVKMNHNTCDCPKWYRATNGPLVALLALGWLGFGGWWYTCKVRYMCETKPTVAAVTPETTSVAPATPAEPAKEPDAVVQKPAETPAVAPATPVATGKPANAKVYFAPDSSLLQLDATEKTVLGSVAKYLATNAAGKVSATGYTTNLRGSGTGEVTVGQLRAEAVKAYLVSNGASEAQVTVVSKGAEAANAANAADQTEFRRVDVAVTN
jgi:outer membrane protein OmpA-like peptidoglycan-associated protein